MTFDEAEEAEEVAMLALENSVPRRPVRAYHATVKFGKLRKFPSRGSLRTRLREARCFGDVSLAPDARSSGAHRDGDRKGLKVDVVLDG